MRLEEELKNKPISNPFERAMLNIMFTSYWLQDSMSTTFKPYDISEQQYNVLRILKGQEGKTVNLQDIQGRMIHKMSNATRLVEKLRMKGLVSRLVCEHNRRKVEIGITKKGLNLLEKLNPQVNANQQLISNHLTKEEAQVLGELLDKLRG